MLKLILSFYLFIYVLCGSTRHRDFDDIQQHVDSEVHDLEYDHRAFLGRKESESYLELTPEESKARLKDLVENKVDLNNDGKVSKTELKDWISYVSKKWLLDERDRVWNDFNTENKTLLEFKTYAEITFGENFEERYKGDELKKILTEIETDKLKWQSADENGDGLLDVEEFFGFIRPEEVPRMKSFLIDEMLARTDKNHDNYLDIDEYTDELYTREPNLVRGKDPVPDWIKYDLENFSFYRDKNNDQRMDKEEIGEWIMPTNYDGVASEVYHLIAKADMDKDGELSIDEIMDKAEIFAGSSASFYGSSLDSKEEL